MTEQNLRQALFFNFTAKPFTGYWGGKGRTFKAGEKMYMEEWRARHYAKHLTNQVLLEMGKENSTSPKFPEQVPDFINLFNKACIVEPDQDENQNESDLINKQHDEQPSSNIPGKPAKVPTIVDDKEPQIIKGPDDEDDFEGLNDNDKE